MGFADNYVRKNNLSANIIDLPINRLGLIIVIPAFNEPLLIKSLESLWNCVRPISYVEILIVINSPEGAEEKIEKNNLTFLKLANEWISKHQDNKFQYHIIYKPNLPKKHAGVGLARKIGMDEAIIRFNNLNKPEGLIVNFDADSVCDTNYLVEIEKFFVQNKKAQGVSIYFEHPVSGIEFSSNIYESIMLYELHLRYYKQALQFTGFPFYYHTVGSAFAVRADVYCKQGGMNKRQAGEDFYFLQKIIQLGYFHELYSTRVIPSPRTSNRVPFGTGAAMTQMDKMEKPAFETYNIDAFNDLKIFINKVDTLFMINKNSLHDLVNSLPQSIKVFLLKNNFNLEVQRANNNSTEIGSFKKQFYQWFNAFRVIRYLNTSHEAFYKKNDVQKEALKLLKEIKVNIVESDLLKIYRELDRGIL